MIDTTVPTRDTIGYRVTVTSMGNVTLPGVVVEDPKPGPAMCPEGLLASGLSLTVTATGSHPPQAPEVTA
jgi:hypothetical protein